jgi:hypothetical protein
MARILVIKLLHIIALNDIMGISPAALVLVQ